MELANSNARIGARKVIIKVQLAAHFILLQLAFRVTTTCKQSGVRVKKAPQYSNKGRCALEGVLIVNCSTCTYCIQSLKITLNTLILPLF